MTEAGLKLDIRIDEYNKTLINKDWAKCTVGKKLVDLKSNGKSQCWDPFSNIYIPCGTI